MNLSDEYLTEQGLSSSFPLRFVGKVDFKGPEDCWLWKGSTRPSSKRWPRGHGMIQRMEGRNWKIYAHRAAWVLFVGPIPEGRMVLHKCPTGTNPQCCNPRHLYLGDGFDNMRDMTAEGHNYFSGKSFAGEAHAMHKLTRESVDEIRRLHATGNYFLRELAEKFGVSLQAIHGIVTFKNWK